MIKHILFDLDGTLLPMVQEEFTKFYLPMLAKSYVDAGLTNDPKALIGTVWTGFEAMVKNNGDKTNREVFWENFIKAMPMDREKAESTANIFYSGDFNKVIAATSPNPLADKVIKTVRAKGIKAYLATNPVFPGCATLNRVKWAGLDSSDFEIITTYEDSYYCKPNVKYFEEILKKFSIEPEECIMVGNDVSEDLVIRRLGVKTFLVTDTMENKKNLPIDTEYQGSMADLLAFIESF